MAEHDDTVTLRLEGIRKAYGVGTPAETEVLHGIDLILKRGEFAALIGPSGSGKSTLLNIIGLLDQPSAGKLFITGQPTEQLKDNELTRLRASEIGFIFQFHNLLPAFTALENVMLPRLAALGRPDEAMRLRAAELIEKVGLTPWLEHKSNDLSGGQQQRVAIARALVMNPALVLADEPTGNLDTKSADSVFDLMRDMNKTNGTTFLIVTHDPRLAQRCDRIIELVDGNIASDKANLNVLKNSDSATQMTSCCDKSSMSLIRINSNKKNVVLRLQQHHLLRTIAIYQVIKGLAAMIASLSLLNMTHQNMRQLITRLIKYFHLDLDAHYFKTLFDYTDLLNNDDLHTLVFMAFVYALIRFTEGYGLWKCRTWAEWLAAISGAIYLPIEISHLIKHVSIINIAVLATNVAVVAYMIYRLRWRRIEALKRLNLN